MRDGQGYGINPRHQSSVNHRMGLNAEQRMLYNMHVNIIL